jgi:hypothetical protein
MSHGKFKEWIRSAVVDEIAREDWVVLKEHLAGCGECRNEFRELRQMMTVLSERGVREPSEDMLWEARRDLSASLKHEPALSISTRKPQSVASQVSPGSPRTPSGWFAGWFGGFRLALSAAAAVAVGLFAGYLLFSGVPATEKAPYEARLTDQELGGPMIANVQFVSRDPKTNEIEIEYDLVRPVRLRADADDDRMQRVLAYAVINEENAGTRLRAIDALDTHGKRVHDNDVKLALIKALRADPNPGVRKHSLEVLSRMPFDRDIKDACLYVLASDDNEGLRVGAIDLLARANSEGHVAGKEIYDFINSQLETEDDAYLRARSTAFIEEVNREQ